MKMAKLNIFGAIGFIIVSISVIQQSGGLGLGDFREPGPGLYPGLIGLLLLIVSVMLIIQSLFRLRKREDKGEPITAMSEGLVDVSSIGFERDKVMRVGLVVVLLLLSSVFLEMAGFLMSAFFLVFVIVRFIERESLVLALVISACSSVVPFVIFRFFLQVPLPTGPLGFF